MQTPQYDSVPDCNSEKKNRKESSKLAQDSFDAFRPFINVFDCGLQYNGSPFHVITKEDWNLFRRHKAGERNLHFPDGTRFNPYLHVVRNIFGPDQAHQHIEEGETTYYTSGKNGLGLLYLDIDAHHDWQTDEYKAKRVLKKLFPFGHFRASPRGQNGYLKVRYTSISEFNQAAKCLEKQLKRLFLHLGILCDIEVKGTITHKGKSGTLAKLPFNNSFPCHMRDDTDSWNYPQLRLFKACPVVNARRVKHLVGQLQPRIDEERVRRFSEHKRLLKDRDEPKDAPIPVVPKRTKSAQVSPTPVIPKKKNRVIVKPAEPGHCEGNAFVRNQKVLLPFVREFYQKNRQFPDTNDALSFLRDNRLFSGRWEDRENHRAKRVGQILDFTEQTFDPNVLGSDESQPLSLSLGRYEWWVRQKFGSGITARLVDVRRFDPVTMTAPVNEVFVPGKFIETFLVVADVCLNRDPLDNRAVPTNRIKKLWGMVKDGAPWNQRYFQIVRDRLERMGVIRIIDRKHQAGKAWRWDTGPEFPAESWKAHQRKLQDELPRGEAEELSLGSNILENNKGHNTLYQITAGFWRLWPRVPAVRPPPI